VNTADLFQPAFRQDIQATCSLTKMHVLNLNAEVALDFLLL